MTGLRVVRSAHASRTGAGEKAQGPRKAMRQTHSGTPSIEIPEQLLDRAWGRRNKKALQKMGVPSARCPSSRQRKRCRSHHGALCQMLGRWKAREDPLTPPAPIVVRLLACNGVKVTTHGPFYWTRSGIFSHQSSYTKERSHHNVLDKLSYLIRRASLREEDFPCVT